MRRWLLTCTIGCGLAFLVPAPLPAQAAAQPDGVAGTWWNQERTAHINVYREGDTWAGKIVWLKDSLDSKGNPVLDSENPDPGLRTRPTRGIVILKGFAHDGNNTWSKGTIYDPKNGKTYSCKMTLVSQNRLDIRGFIGISLIGRTAVWTRVESEDVSK